MNLRLQRHVTQLDLEPREALSLASRNSDFFWNDGCSGLTFCAFGALALGAVYEAADSRSITRSSLVEQALGERFHREQVHREEGGGEPKLVVHHLGDERLAPLAAKLPMRLHVRAFDATEPTSRESPWRGWPRARSWLPRHVVVAPGDGTALLVTQRLDSETGLPPVAELASDFRDGFARSASAPRPWSPAVVESTPDETARVDYLTRVARAREAVRRGELRKVVVARSEQVRGVRAFDGGMQHAALVAAAPSAIAFALTLDGLGTWLGATPEVLARAEDGVVATSAIAGTALRSVDPDGSALRRDAKIAVEHALVVEAMRETLAPLLEGLEVASSPRVLVSERLVHLETQMRGLLRGRASATKPSLMEITQALHPTPALGGAPRAAALRWLREHEGLDRGYFGGPIGWEAPSGDGVLAVGIRSALLRGAEATLFAGAGIVADSDPEAEWLETAAKLGLARSTLCTPSEVVGSGRPADERTGHEPRLVEVTP